MVNTESTYVRFICKGVHVDESAYVSVGGGEQMKTISRDSRRDGYNDGGEEEDSCVKT